MTAKPPTSAQHIGSNEPRMEEAAPEREGAGLSRRSFLDKLGILSVSAVAGAELVRSDTAPSVFVPAGRAQSAEPVQIAGKEGLTVMNDRPLVAETPAHLLDDPVTPGRHLFIRNNGLIPPPAQLDPDKWTLEIAGESCERPTTFTLKELKEKFPHRTLQMVLECAGNGRSEFNPPTTGTQWTTGGVGCPKWTGIPLAEVLKHCGVKKDAVYLGYYGADLHLSGDPKRTSISRGVPIQKALEDESLLVFAMNGENLPIENGHPLRLMFGGRVGSTCGKWVKKIVIRDREHDGEKMTGHSYRMPRYPVAPGTEVPEEDMEVIAELPVKSLVTSPKSGSTHPLAGKLQVRGHAWVGEGAVASVHVSTDFGMTWKEAELDHPVNRYAWQQWRADLTFPKKGYYEVWARATDDRGRSQPMVLPGWNPRGYLNNTCHRLAIQIA